MVNVPGYLLILVLLVVAKMIKNTTTSRMLRCEVYQNSRLSSNGGSRVRAYQKT